MKRAYCRKSRDKLAKHFMLPSGHNGASKTSAPIHCVQTAATSVHLPNIISDVYAIHAHNEFGTRGISALMH